ncbi:L-threonylcarbamoyladenylate synthase [Lactococcus garvieae]|uniref:L-threonylcarbamoyladenylate synthase n=1 Tax=Lactococcus garvieae TaxID=1363 RepID=UPI00254E87A3|nr:L-threonylcarbamoyladenylate synthase [Lactococcus garvieae]
MKILSSDLRSCGILKNSLANHKPVIIPTDTNYNLACFPQDVQGIDAIFSYKERPKNKPLSLFFHNPKDWRKYGEVSDERLMTCLIENFWPGALNIVVKNKTNYSYMLNGSDSIALGCISNPTWRMLVNSLDSPIAITSANISGTADDLLISEDVAVEHMGTKVEYMLKSQTPIQSTKSSTIISIVDGVRVLREGDITREQIQLAISEWGYELE